MNDGIYYITFKYHGINGDNSLMLGASPHAYKSSQDIFKLPNSIALYLNKKESSVFLSGAKISSTYGRNSNAAEFMLIFNMNEHTLSYVQNDSEPVLIKKHLPHFLTPFVEVAFDGNGVELVSVKKE